MMLKKKKGEEEYNSGFLSDAVFFGADHSPSKNFLIFAAAFSPTRPGNQRQHAAPLQIQGRPHFVRHSVRLLDGLVF
jgi:hypothetical protein